MNLGWKLTLNIPQICYTTAQKKCSSSEDDEKKRNSDSGNDSSSSSKDAHDNRSVKDAIAVVMVAAVAALFRLFLDCCTPKKEAKHSRRNGDSQELEYQCLLDQEHSETNNQSRRDLVVDTRMGSEMVVATSNTSDLMHSNIASPATNIGLASIDQQHPESELLFPMHAMDSESTNLLLV